ncbi:hypothetical protein GCM10027034_01710 [Ramlibacter solisilvae]|uniref:Uncharacterized protein n=1 Tax=Ramlibacter tataouinensis TaxID=94132 RepID=A0A127JNY9_9BURK|nr:hypothetical protein [Ramlibacter tataouinensis]AMO21718.1 hypothetical protein UC35_01060 [Ramlibacter tataouinensis]
MQTLVGVFDKRSEARRAMDRLLRSGFDPAELHLKEPGRRGAQVDPAGGEQDRALGDRMMASVERELAVDPDAFEAITRFFSGLFGGSDEAGASYSEAVRNGQSVLVVDAMGDHLAEVCAVILHEEGACDVDDHLPHEVPEDLRRRVQKVERAEQHPPLRELLPEGKPRAEAPSPDHPDKPSPTL